MYVDIQMPGSVLSVYTLVLDFILKTDVETACNDILLRQLV